MYLNTVGALSQLLHIATANIARVIEWTCLLEFPSESTHTECVLLSREYTHTAQSQPHGSANIRSKAQEHTLLIKYVNIMDMY